MEELDTQFPSYCLEFIAVSSLDDDDNILDTEWVCSHSYIESKPPVIIDFEVSDYTSLIQKSDDNLLRTIAKIPIHLDIYSSKNLTINLINADVATSIDLNFSANENLSLTINSFTIQCFGLCHLNIVNHYNYLKVVHFSLMNAVLIKQPNLEVNYCTMKASEEIKTFLPIVNDTAEIFVLPSEDMLAVQNLLRGVNIIPGSGEYVYDTKVQVYKDGTVINKNNPKDIADSIYNTETLKRNCPNAKWISPVVSWFGFTNTYVKEGKNTRHQLDIANIEIMPAVEHKEERNLDAWRVGKYSRSNTPLILKDSKKRPIYGGTINDESISRYVDYMRNQGYKIMFYPMLFMNLHDKPWRGHIFSSNADEISNFFHKEEGYNNFILHYAQMMVGKIDAFVIGSEFKQLSQTIDYRYSYSDPKRYPVVIELINLAKNVKKILGNNTIITYAADWSEYHHDDTGFYHLDPLWASDYIDVVGIDAYFPLTNKTKGDITLQEIKEGWQSGELWDFYFDKDGIKKLDPEWGLKQIEHWWKDSHFNDGIKTLWQPKMKPIWFTEFGFPSIHMSTNQPNIFWNPESRDGGIPKYSSGNVNYALQMRSIRATLEYWQSKNDIIQNMFLWTWDVRPYPAFPEDLKIWSDGSVWSRGHWINGKIEPISHVTLVGNIQVKLLLVYAEKLFLEKQQGINAGLIIANQVYLPASIYGKKLGIVAHSIFPEEGTKINLDYLFLESMNDIIFSASKTKTEKKFFLNNEEMYYYDEQIERTEINAITLTIKCPKLRLESTFIWSRLFKMLLNNLELISEVETHVYRRTINKDGFFSSKEREYVSQTQKASVIHISAEELYLSLKEKFYAIGALIQTNNFNGYAESYTFDPLVLESRFQFCSSKRVLGGFLGSSRETRSGQDLYYHGALFIIKGEGYAFAEDKMSFYASYLLGQRNVEVDVKTILLKVAIGKHFQHVKIEERGIKFGAAAGGGEISLGVLSYYRSLQASYHSETPYYSGLLARNLKIIANELQREGGIISAENKLILNVERIVDKSPRLRERYDSTEIIAEAGIKIGFEESFSGSFDSMKNILLQLKKNNPAAITAINFVSDSYALFMKLTNINNSNGIQGGVWIYGKTNALFINGYKERSLPNPIHGHDVDINADYWHMERLEATGQNYDLKVKKIEGAFTEDSEYCQIGSGEVGARMNIFGTPGVGANMLVSTYEKKVKENHLNRINLKGRFNLLSDVVEGGIHIESKELKVVVGLLKLESCQDTTYESGATFSANIGFNNGDIVGGSVNGQKQNAHSRITNIKSGFVGKDLLLINATNLIYLEGAYLDTIFGGELRVETKSIKVASLKDEARSKVTGVGVDSGNNIFGPGARAIVGNENQEREVRGAIGDGIIIVGRQEVDTAMSQMLGISRDTTFKELKGKSCHLDATIRTHNSQEVNKAWEDGILGAISYITQGAKDKKQVEVAPVLPDEKVKAAHAIQNKPRQDLISDISQNNFPSISIESSTKQVNEEFERTGEILLSFALESLEIGTKSMMKFLPKELSEVKNYHIIKIHSITFTIDYMLALEEAKQKYGNLGVQTKAISLAQTIGSTVFSTTGGILGGVVGTALSGIGTVTFSIGGAVGGGYIYDHVKIGEKSINDWMGDGINDFFMFAKDSFKALQAKPDRNFKLALQNIQEDYIKNMGIAS